MGLALEPGRLVFTSELSHPETVVLWLSAEPIFFLIIIFFVFFVFSMAYGGSQARGLTRAVASGLHHSPSNVGSKPHLRPTPQLMATPDP